jgi:hypothetical protein
MVAVSIVCRHRIQAYRFLSSLDLKGRDVTLADDIELSG